VCLHAVNRKQARDVLRCVATNILLRISKPVIEVGQLYSVKYLHNLTNLHLKYNGEGEEEETDKKYVHIYTVRSESCCALRLWKSPVEM
jgi:hypothetical protein